MMIFPAHLATVSNSDGINEGLIIAAAVCLFAATALALASLLLLLFYRQAARWGLWTALGAILFVQFPLLFGAYIYKLDYVPAAMDGTKASPPIWVALAWPLGVLLGSALLAFLWQRRISKTAP
jgi:hypothetical protein